MVKANIDYLIDAKRRAGSAVTHARIGKTGKAEPVTFMRGTKNIVMIGGINAKNYMPHSTKAKQRKGELGAKSKLKSNSVEVLVGGKWEPLDADLGARIEAMPE